jgi:hypothetical protein
VKPQPLVIVLQKKPFGGEPDKINMLGSEHQAMQKRIDAHEAHLCNVRISLGNYVSADFELGWQVKMLKLKILELKGKLKEVSDV